MSNVMMEKLDARIHEVRTASHMRDYAESLLETSYDTGYDYDYLADAHHELLDDGQDFIESLIDVITIAYEQDY